MAAGVITSGYRAEQGTAPEQTPLATSLGSYPSKSTGGFGPGYARLESPRPCRQTRAGYGVRLGHEQAIHQSPLAHLVGWGVAHLAWLFCGFGRGWLGGQLNSQLEPSDHGRKTVLDGRASPVWLADSTALWHGSLPLARRQESSAGLGIFAGV